MISRQLSLLALALCLGLSTVFPQASAQPSTQYDLIIRQGRIVDGTGNPGFIGDLAVRKDRIVSIARKLTGQAEKTINANGLVVAPGFIDIHSHSEWTLFEDGQAQSKIRQGVTTDIVGEGFSPGPFKGKLTPRPVSVQGDREYVSSLKEYFEALERAGTAINIASYVGLGNLWQSVMGHSFEQPTDAELDQMKALLAEAMEHGALGLSSQLMMPPGLLATTDQVAALCEVVHQHGGIFSSHIRNEGLGVFKAVKQAIEIGERAQVPVDIIHIKIADQQYWGRMNEIVALIDAARNRGVNVQANVYPYTRGNNNLSSIIPPWAHEGGRQQMLARLQDPAQRPRLKQDIQNGVPGWYNHYTAVGGDWSRMLVSASNKYRGMTMDKVMTLRTEGKEPQPDLLDELFDLLIETDGSVSTVYAHHTEADMNLALSQPWCSIGSDGSALAIEGVLRRGNPHPRNFGTFPRVLGRYVRENNLLTLEEAIRKMTSLNAAKVGIHDRGLLKPGLFADITILDPETVIDRADYTDPFHNNRGIRHVIVNGQIVLENERHTGAEPGRALRRASGY